jgi:Rod binding domain-containing protein
MDISPIHREVRAAELPLERLAASQQVSQEDKIAEVSRQFEAVLLRQILSQAQKPMFKSSLLAGDGTSSAIYQDMITQQLADRISKGGTFGFAKVLEQQLSFEYTGHSSKDANSKVGPEPAPASPEQVQKFISPATQPGKRI